MNQSIIDVAKSPLFMQWSDDYSVGINNIDNQHMRIMNELRQEFRELKRSVSGDESIGVRYCNHTLTYGHL